jgi:hypothetical protein
VAPAFSHRHGRHRQQHFHQQYHHRHKQSHFLLQLPLRPHVIIFILVGPVVGKKLSPRAGVLLLMMMMMISSCCC